MIIIAILIHYSKPYLVSGDSNDSVELWNLKNHEIMRTMNENSSDGVYSLCIIKDNENLTLAIGHDDGVIKL